jgi:hypothetical protein
MTTDPESKELAETGPSSDNVALYSPLDRRLAHYLELQEKNPLDKQIADLRAAVEHFGENLAAHIQECHDFRTADNNLARSTEARLVNLESGGSKGRKSTPPPPPVSASILPPMRSLEDSTHDLRIDVDTIKTATLEGARREDTTPDEEVEKALDKIIERKKNDARLAELEAKAAEGIAQAKALAEQVARKAEERSKFYRSLILQVLGGGAALYEIVRQASGHH